VAVESCRGIERPSRGRPLRVRRSPAQLGLRQRSNRSPAQVPGQVRDAVRHSEQSSLCSLSDGRDAIEAQMHCVVSIPLPEHNVIRLCSNKRRMSTSGDLEFGLDLAEQSSK